MTTVTGSRPRRWLATPVALLAVALVAGCGAFSVAEPRSADPQSAAAGSPASGSASLLAFTGTTVDGKPFAGASLLGKPTVLWFWAPWCPTCLMQAKGVREAVAASGDRVNIVGVAGLATTKDMPEFIRLAKLSSMTHIADEAGAVWKSFEVTEQSWFAMLDAAGKVTFVGRLAPKDIPARVAALA